MSDAPPSNFTPAPMDSSKRTWLLASGAAGAACAASAVNPLRMSVAPAASQTRVFAGTGITPSRPASAAPEPRDHSSR